MHQLSRALVSLLTVAFICISPSVVFADSTESFDFNTPGSLSTNFHSYAQTSGGYVAPVQGTTGGISNTGSIETSGSSNAVFTTVNSYSLGNVGSTYTFTSFVKSVGNSGYSGLGFTSYQIPTVSNVGGTPFRPLDALGISAHGGGYVFHNGGTDKPGNWDVDTAGVTSITRAGINDLLNSGSADDWYKLVFKLTRDTSTTFDARIEVWPADASGTLLHPSAADAIFEWRDLTNNTLNNAAVIYSYINFSGYRVTNFDNYSVSVAGGASIVAAGTPVVLTTTTTESSGVVSFSGNVTADNGASITERGFVYGTSTSPTISDNKEVVGSGTGTFSGVTSTLANGTYYFRSYATNSTGTSYGSENTIVVTSGATPSATPSSTAAGASSSSSTTSQSATSTQTLAATGSGSLMQFGLLALLFLAMGFSIMIVTNRVSGSKTFEK